LTSTTASQPGSAAEHGRQHLAQRDEGDVAGHELGREWQLGEMSCVHAVHHDHARISAHALVELRPADVERDHLDRASLEEDVGEAARRGADVQAAPSVGVDAEDVEGMVELLAAPGDEPLRLGQLQRSRLVDLLPGFGEAGHPPGHHERLRLRARLGQAALDEQHVEALFHPT
jgi:hypothetical protein